MNNSVEINTKLIERHCRIFNEIVMRLNSYCKIHLKDAFGTALFECEGIKSSDGIMALDLISRGFFSSNGYLKLNFVFYGLLQELNELGHWRHNEEYINFVRDGELLSYLKDSENIKKILSMNSFSELVDLSDDEFNILINDAVAEIEVGKENYKIFSKRMNLFHSRLKTGGRFMCPNGMPDQTVKYIFNKLSRKNIMSLSDSGFEDLVTEIETLILFS